MTSANSTPEPEIIPPGQNHGYRDGGAGGRGARGPGASGTGASGPGAQGTMDDLGEKVSGVIRHPMTMPRVVYGLYALSVVSGFPMLIGLIVAYVARGDAPQWMQSHYTFMIRTFWYFVVLACIGFVLAIILVGFMLLWVLPFWIAIRVIRGWLLLQDRKPIPNPDSWLFG